MKKLCLIYIIFWIVPVISGCGDITYERSLRIPVEIDTNYDAKMVIAKKVAQEVHIDLEERLLTKFPNVSKERLNNLEFLYGWEVEPINRTVFVEIKISWNGEFNEANAILEYYASEVIKALKNVEKGV